MATTNPKLTKLAELEAECVRLAETAQRETTKALLGTAAASLRLAGYSIARLTDSARIDARIEEALLPVVKALGVAEKVGSLSKSESRVAWSIASGLCSAT
jgi:hypothetical protein